MPIQVGQKAPDFTLYNTKREQKSLSDYQGKNVLLLFFPLAFTGVCTKELCEVRDGLEKYNQMNAQVLGISIDTPFTLGKFKEELNLNFILLSDFNKHVSKSYDAQYEEFILGLKGVAKRSAFVIDKEGTVQYAEVLDNAGELPNFSKIKETLSNLN